MKLGVVVSSAAVQFELCYFSELNDHFLPLVIQFRTSDFSACPSYSEFLGSGIQEGLSWAVVAWSFSECNNLRC